MPDEIEFHSGVNDLVGFAVALLRKALGKGVEVAVIGPPDLLAGLDRALWEADRLSFLPHVRLRRGEAASARLSRTPLWLLDDGAVPPRRDVLVNLGAEPPQALDGYARVIEVVGASPELRAAGRQRWRIYEGRGLAIRHHARTPRH